MFNIEEILQNIRNRYHNENPDALKVNIKIINGSGWYRNKIGEEFNIWSIPDKFHTELFGDKAYYIADGHWEWQGLVRGKDIEFL